MREQHIREILMQVCQQLDVQARRAALPAAAGVVLALGGCSSQVVEEGVFRYMAPFDAMVRDGSSPIQDSFTRSDGAPARDTSVVPEPTPDYAVPWDSGVRDVAVDSGAPDVSDDGDVAVNGGVGDVAEAGMIDAPVARYMAPEPEPRPAYMIPSR